MDAPDREPDRTAFLVADVRTGDREAAGRLRAAERSLAEHGVAAEVWRSSGPDEVFGMVRAGLGAGYRWVVCVGDDAAIRSAIDGLMEEGKPVEPGVVLGVMAAHGWCDFVRTFGIRDDPAFAAERLATGPTQPLDVAKVRYVDRSGGERTSHFAGVAEVGLGGAVVRRAARLPQGLGRTGDFVGFWATLATYRPPELRVIGERREYRGRAHTVIVGNCQWIRRGLRLSPRSFPGDGFLDLLVMTGPRSDAFTMLPRMFQGEQVPDPSIQEYRARHIVVQADRPVPFHADGVPLGTTPLEIDLTPHALDLRV